MALEYLNIHWFNM